jgi:hypothetical protein
MNFRAIRPELAPTSLLTPAGGWRERLASGPMKKALIVSTLLAGGLVACGPQGSYREVKVAQGGGEVALEGDRTLAHQKAEGYMTSKCQAGYTILEEGEATVGTDTSTSSSTSGVRSRGISFGKSKSNQSSTRDATEWRVKYQCKDASPPPASGGTAPPPPAGASLASPSKERVAEIHEVRIRM